MSSYGYNRTRDQVIYGALRLVGALASGETPDINQLTDAAEALNLLMLQWETEGLPLWAIQEDIIPLIQSQPNYVFGATDNIKAFEITDCVMHNKIANTDIKMLPLSRSDYLQLGNKAAIGTPTQYYLELDNMTSQMFVYPMPDLNASNQYEIHVWFQRPFQTFDTSTDVPDLPNEFLNALKWNLAVMIAPEYGFPGGGSTFDRIVAMAKDLKDEAFNFNIEHTSVIFQPDRWSMYHKGY